MRTLVVGDTRVDLVCERPVDSPAEADSFVAHLGGPAAAIAVVAARGGGDVALAAALGDDDLGRRLQQRLALEGIDGSWLALRSGAPTPIALVTVDADAEPAVVAYGGGGPDRVEDALRACDAVVLAPARAEAQGRAHAAAMAQLKPVVLDGRVDAELVAGAFLVRCDAAGARALTGEPEPANAAAALVTLGARVAVVWDPEQGAVLRGEGDIGGEAAAAPARAVDRTGAGEALTGTLVAGLCRNGFDPEALVGLLPAAVEAAARATEHYGAIAP